MFSEPNSVAFYPWVGSKYAGGINGEKVLILGESHYHDCEKDEACKASEERRIHHHQQFTEMVVWGWRNNLGRTPVSTAVPKLFEIEKSEFWDHVSFYNYVQTFVPSRDVRPTADAWDSASAQAFQSVLDFLQPDRVLVLGKENWLFLPSDPLILAHKPEPEPALRLLDKMGNGNAVNGIAYWYFCRSGHRALTMPVFHPAAVGFRVEDWLASIRTWLAFPDSPMH